MLQICSRSLGAPKAVGKSWHEVDRTWDRATELLHGRPEPSSEMTVSTKTAFVKLERGKEPGTHDCPRAAFPFLGFSATLPTPGLGGRVAACQLAVGVEGCLL